MSLQQKLERLKMDAKNEFNIDWHNLEKRKRRLQEQTEWDNFKSDLISNKRISGIKMDTKLNLFCKMGIHKWIHIGRYPVANDLYDIKVCRRPGCSAVSKKLASYDYF